MIHSLFIEFRGLLISDRKVSLKSIVQSIQNIHNTLNQMGSFEMVKNESDRNTTFLLCFTQIYFVITNSLLPLEKCKRRRKVPHKKAVVVWTRHCKVNVFICCLNKGEICV